MTTEKNFVLLSPEYEAEYKRRYGRQPKFIPTDFILNNKVYSNVRVRSDYSRIWVSNPKFKKKKVA